MDEIMFSVNENVVFNIDELSKRQSETAEQRICEIHELAESAAEILLQMYNDDYSAAEAISFLSDFIEDKKTNVHTEALEENKELLNSYMSLVSCYDKATFSLLLSESLKKRGIFLSEGDFLDSGETEESIAFVRSPLSSEAFDVFSQSLADPRLKYVPDTKEAVAMVSRGEVGYCILPIEERGGVRLSSISELIFREELKINSVTPVFGPYGGANMKYALLSKKFTDYPVNPGDDRYLEIRLHDNSGVSFSELMTAASVLNVGLYRVNTINFETEDGERKYVSIVFSRESLDFCNILLYMMLFTPDFTPVGIYKNLE